MEEGESAAQVAVVNVGPVTQVSLHVTDLDQAVGFYRDVLGLRHLFTVGDLAFLDIHGIRLYLDRVDREQWRPGSIIYLQVDQIDAAYRALEDAGVTTTSPPHLIYTDEAGTQEWMAFFEDTDGNVLSLHSRVGASPADG